MILPVLESITPTRKVQAQCKDAGGASRIEARPGGGTRVLQTFPQAQRSIAAEKATRLAHAQRQLYGALLLV
jgi:hypothetical protein